jgi:large-conductance mechanosensitive channel
MTNFIKSTQSKYFNDPTLWGAKYPTTGTPTVLANTKLDDDRAYSPGLNKDGFTDKKLN